MSVSTPTGLGINGSKSRMVPRAIAASTGGVSFTTTGSPSLSVGV